MERMARRTERPNGSDAADGRAPYLVAIVGIVSAALLFTAVNTGSSAAPVAPSTPASLALAHAAPTIPAGPAMTAAGPGSVTARVAPSGAGALAGQNSSPVAEAGSLVGTVHVGAFPSAETYDTATGEMYVLNYDSGTVSVVNGTEVVGTVNVGSRPIAAVYDPSNSYVYVADYGSDNVSVLSGTDLLATLSVGGFPTAIAYDPVNGYVYVANYASGTVSALDGSRVVGTIGVQPGPSQIVFDPEDDLVYVASATVDVVDAINGTLAVVSLQVPSTGETLPPFHGMVVDEATGALYISGFNARSVTLIDRSVVAATVAVGNCPAGLAYDPREEYVYVANSCESSVTILGGSKVIGTVGVSYAPWNLAYDPANGVVYSGSTISRTLSEIHGTSNVGTLNLGTTTPIVAVDPSHATVLAAGDGTPGAQQTESVYALSTELGIGPLVPDPLGTPPGSSPEGGTIWFNATLWAVGTGSDVAGAYIAPSTGLGCAVQVGLTIRSAVGHLSLACAPSSNATYSVSLNVSDSDGNHVWAELAFTVYPTFFVGRPDPNRTSADAGQSATFAARDLVAPDGAVVFQWSGLDSTCTGTTTAVVTCRFTEAELLWIGVTVTDGLGDVEASPSLPFQVYAPPAVGEVRASAGTLDVGGTLALWASVEGGLAPYTYHWSGVPSGCPSAATAIPTCRVDEAGTVDASLVVTDGNGMASSPSPIVTVEVFPDPVITALDVSPDPLAAGGSVRIAATISGGTGDFTYAWWGLPENCTIAGAVVACRPAWPGTFAIHLVVADSTGTSATSLTRSLVVLAPTAPSPTPTTATPAGSTIPVDLAWWSEGGLGAVGPVLVVLIYWLGSRKRPNARGGSLRRRRSLAPSDDGAVPPR